MEKKKAKKKKINKEEFDKTKKYKTKKNKKKNRKHPVLRKIILIIVWIIIICCLAGAGVFAGLFFGDKWTISKEMLLIKDENTMVYDKNGELICELSGTENRKVVTMSEMSEYLPKAFVAIEDKRFYEHHGVDIKRTAAATLSFLKNRGTSSVGGGSSITQQLVKNVTEEDDSEGLGGIQRKISEMSRAYKIEKMLSKYQILEIYLNEIYLGGFGKNIHGVEVASQYYFSKPAKDLDLAESAFIAGINHAPNSYNPFLEDKDNSEKIKNRTLTVLSEMKKNNILTAEEEDLYNAAVAKVEAGLPFQEGQIANKSSMTYIVRSAIAQAAEQMAEEQGIAVDFASNQISSGGYKLYTTQDTAIYNRLKEEFEKGKYIKSGREKNEDGSLKNEHSQAAMVIIDHKTGQVVGMYGELGEGVSVMNLNRSFSPRQPGSSIKPIACVAPGIEQGVINAATVYDDSPTSFGKDYAPGNSTGYQGLCTVRTAIERSSNVVNVKIISNVTPKKSIQFMKQLGITSLDDTKDANLSLALGGLTTGISPIEMAAAYATIANDGTYIEPTFFTKLENASGTVVLEAKQETRKVMSNGNAYIVKEILTQPVVGSGGTATGCKISGMEVGAKTGTTNDSKDRWLCGITPYYTAAAWYGYDEPEIVYFSGNPAAQIWAAVMRDIHKNLENAKFEKPDNIVTETVCSDTGKLATSQCTRTHSEYFVKDAIPEKCDGHSLIKVCKETGYKANEYCPETEERASTARPEKEVDPAWSTSEGGKYDNSLETCPVHTKDTKEKVKVPNLVGKTKSEAQKELTKLGLKYNIETKSDSSKEEGVVLSQRPSTDTEVEKGATITIVVNKKEEEEPEPSNTIPENGVDTNTTTNETAGENGITET